MVVVSVVEGLSQPRLLLSPETFGGVHASNTFAELP